ncbi:MAG: hypothetical protein ACRD44_13755 [Bryobacteraceae bacterium]
MPQGLVKRVAEREEKNKTARGHYTYRQTVTLEEIDPRSGRGGLYREVRDIIFSPAGERAEKLLGSPANSLSRLRMTDEDFRDIREVQPFLLAPDQTWMYSIRFRGDDRMDGVDCWVLEVAPKQVFHGQRLFEGMFWVDKSDDSIVRSEGRAVPQILSTRSENLFPRFTTLRQKIEGFSFPVHTQANDILPFSSGALRVRMSIRYEDYKRFASDVKITFH